MMWLLVITNIIGWAIAIASTTMAGMILVAYGAALNKSIDSQRPNINSKVKLFNVENKKDGQSVPEAGSL